MGIKNVITCVIGYGTVFVVLFGAGYGLYSFHLNKMNNARSEYYEKGYDTGYNKGKIEGLREVHQSYQNILSELDSYHKETQNTAENYIFTAQRLEKIMNKSNPALSEEKKDMYKKYIMKWSSEYGLSPVFVASIIHRETNFRENLVSSAGARGAMQVIPKWHKDKMKSLGITEKDLSNINYGINIGCQVIREYLDAADWDYKKALHKYVGAINNVGTANKYVADIFEMTIYAYSQSEKTYN